MEEITPSKPTTPSATENSNSQDSPRRTNPNNAINSNSVDRPNQPNNCSGPVLSTPRDFEGATPKIGRILALRSENMTKEVNYDQFCEKLYITS